MRNTGGPKLNIKVGQAGLSKAGILVEKAKGVII
jgi:hypothetical protein